LGRIDALFEIFEVVSGFDIAPPQQSPKAKRKIAQQERKQVRQIRQFLQRVLSDIEEENIRTFLVDMTHPNQFTTAVLLFTDYLRDQTMTEIAHKEYRLLGKAVRKIEKESEESIDLLRGTGLGGIDKDTLQELLWGAFSQMEKMNLPEMKTEIEGPALEVVPIAVFV
jgi:hypothetical protein